MGQTKIEVQTLCYAPSKWGPIKMIRLTILKNHQDMSNKLLRFLMKGVSFLSDLRRELSPILENNPTQCTTDSAFYDILGTQV